MHVPHAIPPTAHMPLGIDDKRHAYAPQRTAQRQIDDALAETARSYCAKATPLHETSVGSDAYLSRHWRAAETHRAETYTRRPDFREQPHARSEYFGYPSTPLHAPPSASPYQSPAPTARELEEFSV